MRNSRFYIYLLLISILFAETSCYKQNLMFQTEDYEVPADIKSSLSGIEKNYILKPGDFISIKVQTNNGELLVDPNFQMRTELGMMRNQNSQGNLEDLHYLIRADSIVKLPLVGKVNLVGKTLYQSDSILNIEYSNFYKEAFVLTSISNRRVFVFNGQKGEVIPLLNENTSLIEVLASAGGMENLSKSHNIRLIRGDLSNPYVEVIDLSTIQGMTKANLQVRNKDIIYVEPIRRVIVEATRDYSPVIGLITSLITLIVIVTN